MLPLAVSLSQSQLRMISTIGMGVLVGTSMIVIIPEGIETMYSAPQVAAMHRHPAAAVQARGEHFDWSEARRSDVFITARGAGEVGYIWARDSQEMEEHDHDHQQAPPPPPESMHEHEHEHSHEDSHEEEEEEAEASSHKWVGLSLVSGFILMYLIDVLPSHRHSSDSQPYHIAIDNLRGSMTSPGPVAQSHMSKPGAMTLGLVIHAAADGIALGASSASQNLALGAIIFIAIMLHKAPAAFGLTAVLLRGGLGKRQVRTHLTVFSLAAPAGAIVTWLFLGLLGGEATGGAGLQWWTGVLLLFSGGTFL
jgi:zinc transporter 9